MNSFQIRLLDNSRDQRIDGVRSFVGEDASGSFGIMAGHAPLMTSLVFGLARFRKEGEPWLYLALPGAILHFGGGVLTLNTRRWLLDEDYAAISQGLLDELTAEERDLSEMKHSLRNIETRMLRQMLEIERDFGGSLAL